jgi:hypothetical protein
MSKTSAHVAEWSKLGFKDFIPESFISAPNTQISNRALIRDDSQSLKPLMGIERVQIRTINLIEKEYGTSGERVFEPGNKDNRFRFVGNWAQLYNATGSFVFSSSQNDYIEATFYGTGLNLLAILNSGARDIRITIDGGVEGANIYTAGSTVLDSRNYNTNQVLKAVSGLSLGWHTVKIRNASASVAMNFYGFEILNESTQVKIAAGSAFSGSKKDYLSAVTASDYNTGVSGSRGARVVKYLLNGAISQVVQEVNPTVQYLTSANHDNEEVVRVVHWREFGSNRADDFSTLGGSSSARAFTLEDGTTSLICSTATTETGFSGATDEEVFRIGSVAGAHATITFVGTGLDIDFSNGFAGRSVVAIYVDGGASIGSISMGVDQKRVKIVSGLPYGTHTVRFEENASNNSPGFKNFVVYQPKKPTVPAGAVEITDYNVMATYSGSSISGTAAVDNNQVATGTLFKHSSREKFYSGSFSSSFATSASIGFYTPGGGYASSSTVGNYVEYSFFGSGFVMHLAGSSGGTLSMTVSIDGSLNATGVARSNMSNGGGGTYSTTTTSPDAPCRVEFTGLSLGLHTVRITKTAGTGSMLLAGIFVITPIHSHDKGFFKTGSLSLQDSRVFKPFPVGDQGIDLSKAKALLKFNAGTSKIQWAQNVAAVVTDGTGIYQIYFERPFKSQDRMAVFVSARDNGVTVVGTLRSGDTAEVNRTDRVTIHTINSAFSGVDCEEVYVAVFGELDGEDVL